MKTLFATALLAFAPMLFGQDPVTPPATTPTAATSDQLAPLALSTAPITITWEQDGKVTKWVIPTEAVLSFNTFVQNQKISKTEPFTDGNGVAQTRTVFTYKYIDAGDLFIQHNISTLVTQVLNLYPPAALKSMADAVAAQQAALDAAKTGAAASVLQPVQQQ